MNQILNTLDKHQVNALFLQPTRWCALNCKGCYVKEHIVEQGTTREQEQHTPVETQIKLVEYYMRANLANQITVSIDDFPPDLGMTEPSGRLMLGLNYGRVQMRNHMLQLYLGLVKTARDCRQYNLDRKEDPGHNIPELHFTYHTVDTLRNYQQSLGIDMQGHLTNIDMVSFSVLREQDLDFLKGLATVTHVNYNHLVPSNVTSQNIDEYVRRMTEIGETVDSIYLVLFKRPVGSEGKRPVELGDRRRMFNDISYIKTMLGRLPEHVRRKCHVDGCLEDTVKFHRTGFGCSANVSRVQVWPDGSVSGCPYAFSGTTPPGYSVQDILENIKEARSVYDFDRCHLPDVHNSITR